ncbi:orotidine-5'-phosphate decarboxylase [Spiroplasma turonicum]|uniref:Orotidine 5'-phosphate decarboxylase n=1 Tax=Spiroplasma turonicum TaxID=216946 RepID=A0A0K1P741_9MOLU|nr:orotidine-5'-phosphate decarboxylase [Spiroplasma turonicum]AKU80014.1 orotidine-5-phosphate decarboxylase [Spiroplasma turonicum]ALX71016.1 orotidine-5'-phosphate decarboxylase [Spiroplasma turonicum]
MKNNIIIALDFSNLKILKSFLKKFKNEKLFVKVGMELFYKYGPKIIKYLKRKGYLIFIDLKIHDIPNTAYKATLNLLKLNPDIITVHAGGGKEMLDSVYKAKKELNCSTQIFAVTYLTSIDENVLKNDLKINKPLKLSICDLATLSYNCKIDGVVCSVWESISIKEVITNDFKTLTPGIRSIQNNSDQKRVATINEAKYNKSDYIVVGREITNSNNPYKKYLELKREWEND